MVEIDLHSYITAIKGTRNESTITPFSDEVVTPLMTSYRCPKVVILDFYEL
jgi:hypothetical protein